MINNIFKQFFPKKTQQNQLIIEILAECGAALDAGVQGTYCSAIFTPCIKQLEKNAKSQRLDIPSWIKTGIQAKFKQEL